MKVKILRSLAASLSEMAVSARLGDTLELLADLPDGTVVVDLLELTCRHSSEGTVRLPPLQEFSEWLAQQLGNASIPAGAVNAATLEIRYRTDRVPTDRSRIVLLDIHSTCRLESMGKVAEKTAQNAIWHHRSRE